MGLADPWTFPDWPLAFLGAFRSNSIAALFFRRQPRFHQVVQNRDLSTIWELLATLYTASLDRYLDDGSLRVQYEYSSGRGWYYRSTRSVMLMSCVDGYRYHRRFADDDVMVPGGLAR